MAWRKAQFKEKEVWVAVDGAGLPAVHDGRVRMRYSSSAGAKVYRAGWRNVQVLEDAKVENLGPGLAADERKKSSRGSGFGKAGTRSVQQKAMAAAAARALINGLDDDVVRCFTDGGCRGNPGPAGSGVYIEMPDGRKGQGCESLGVATNNVGELRAIEIALEMLDELSLPADAPVAIFTDSSYSNGVLCQGWKAKANRELIERIRGRLANRPGVAVHWVAGHVGVEGNERADGLAGQGIDGATFRSWSKQG
jgi:ribonuclease HI